MRTPLAASVVPALVLLSAVATTVSLSPPALRAQEVYLEETDFSYFFDSLSPYGDWIEVGNYGPCWQPNVARNWSPYTEGYWSYTNLGWTWVSREPFGSIVFHYGRWLFTTAGWCWVPGSEWAPAWVSWRKGRDFIGWAPLPPEVPWHAARGIGNWVDVHSNIGPEYYRFCYTREFGSPNLSEVIFRRSENATLLIQTTNVTHIVFSGNGVYCGGPDYRWLNSRVERQIPVLRLHREENLERFRSYQRSDAPGVHREFISNDVLVMPAPRHVRINQPASPNALSSSPATVTKGWRDDERSNAQVRAHVQAEWQKQAQTSNGVARVPEGESQPGTVSTPEKRAIYPGKSPQTPASQQPPTPQVQVIQTPAVNASPGSTVPAANREGVDPTRNPGLFNPPARTGFQSHSVQPEASTVPQSPAPRPSVPQERRKAVLPSDEAPQTRSLPQTVPQGNAISPASPATPISPVTPTTRAISPQPAQQSTPAPQPALRSAPVPAQQPSSVSLSTPPSSPAVSPSAPPAAASNTGRAPQASPVTPAVNAPANPATPTDPRRKKAADSNATLISQP